MTRKGKAARRARWLGKRRAARGALSGFKVAEKLVWRHSDYERAEQLRKARRTLIGHVGR